MPAYDNQSGTSSHRKSVYVAISNIPREIMSIDNSIIGARSILEIIRVFILELRLYIVKKGGS